MRRASCLGVGWLLAACTQQPAQEPARQVSVGTVPAPPRVEALLVAKPLSPPPPEEQSPKATAAEFAARELSLEVPGFLPAYVVIPRHTEPLRLLIATHGAGGGPEPHCADWARRSRGRALVVCPRGRAISQREPQGFYYPDHLKLQAEVLAVVETARREFASELASAGIIYTGYSQGATMGALFVVEHGALFPRLALTEGGFDDWTRARAQKFRASGGERVVLTCGTAHCAARAKESASVLTAAGLLTRNEYVLHGGHSDWGTVGARLDAVADWLFE